VMAMRAVAVAVQPLRKALIFDMGLGLFGALC